MEHSGVGFPANPVITQIWTLNQLSKLFRALHCSCVLETQFSQDMCFPELLFKTIKQAAKLQTKALPHCSACPAQHQEAPAALPLPGSMLEATLNPKAEHCNVNRVTCLSTKQPHRAESTPKFLQDKQHFWSCNSCQIVHFTRWSSGWLELYSSISQKGSLWNKTKWKFWKLYYFTISFVFLNHYHEYSTATWIYMKLT